MQIRSFYDVAWRWKVVERRFSSLLPLLGGVFRWEGGMLGS